MSETTKTDQVKSTMAKRSLRVNDEASQNTKLVKTPSKSKQQASQNTKQVNNQSDLKRQAKVIGKWDESQGKNETKQVKRDKGSQPRPAKRHVNSKTPDVPRQWPLHDSKVNKDHQKSTDVHKSTEPQWQSTTNFSLSYWWSNKLQTRGRKLWLHDQVLLPSRSPQGCSILRHSPRSQQKSTNLIEILLELHFKVGSLQLTGWSPKQTSNDHC